MKIRQKGFTLIELLVVIVIIIILMSIIAVAVTGALQKAKRVSCITNLKELHKSVLLFALDTERKMKDGNDLPKNNEFFNPVNPDKSVILKDYAGVNFDRIRCPLAKDGELGYAVNSKLVNASFETVDKSNKVIPFEELREDNILIYEVVSHSDSKIDKRHNEKAFGVTIYGNIDYDIVDDSYLNNKNT